MFIEKKNLSGSDVVAVIIILKISEMSFAEWLPRCS